MDRSTIITFLSTYQYSPFWKVLFMPPPRPAHWYGTVAATPHTHIPFRVKTSRGKLLVSNWKTEAACLKAAALYFAHQIKYKSQRSAKTRWLLAVYRHETVNTCYKQAIKNRNVGSTCWTSRCRGIRTLSSWFYWTILREADVDKKIHKFNRN